MLPINRTQSLSSDEVTLNVSELPNFSKPIDPIAITDDWLSSGMELSFFGSSILYLIESIQETLLDNEVLYASGIAWCGFEAIAGVIIGISGLVKLRHSKRHRLENATWSFMEIANASQLVAINALTIATSLSALASGFGAAACMWLKCAQTALQLYRAAKKTDTAYLLEDRVIKYQRVKSQIAKLDSAINKQSDQTEIKELKKLSARLEKEAEAIIRVYETEELSSLSPLDKRYVTFEKYKMNFYETKTGSNLNLNSSDEPTAIDKKLVSLLKAKQQEKVFSKAASLAATISASVGITFLAAAVIFPPLLIPGIGFCVLASIIKFTEVTVTAIVNRLAKKQKKAAIQDMLLTGRNISLALIPTQLGDEKTRIKCRLAYELSKRSISEQNPHIDVSILETEYYNSLIKLQENKKLARYLDKALDTYINQKILEEAFTENNENLANDQLLSELSMHHKNQIIAKQARQDFPLFAKKTVAVETTNSDEPDLNFYFRNENVDLLYSYRSPMPA